MDGADAVWEADDTEPVLDTTVASILRDAAPRDYRFSSLILGIVKSAPFQMRRIET